MMLIVPKTVEPTVVERWVDYNDKIKILLRGIDSKEYQIGLERARRLLNKSDSAQSLSSLTATATDETEFGIQAQLLGRYIVKGWQGDVKDSDGQPVAYTPEACIAMINANVGFFSWVISQATQITIEQQGEQAETLGKSLPVTDGKPSESD